uniref:Large ribosomal subunit protein bL20c n=1 Tax=Liagoropsis maxima TaxID=1653392 RepID=A0A1G4NWA2_9FLOR|nr:Ribosomal protein L20 [Liagoropsis maxima]SCW22796.1 Ribosomal protein L20 [Liagoropsis maxima]
MTRVKRGNVARKRRKKILKLARGYRGAHSGLFRTSKQQVLKALRYSYIGRKNKKRDFRSLWICRINAATRSNNLQYSTFVHLLKSKKVGLNRKMLAQMAILDPTSFQYIIRHIS